MDRGTMAAKASDEPACARLTADLAAARRVLRIAADALSSLDRSLDASLGAALDVLVAVRGRIIVSGIGKSGHVARKIAATLASTGSPAQYVHPSEASHGDLGMITAADAVLMLSNSGENRELTDLVTHTRRFAIPLIAMTSNPASALAKASDIALVLPKEPEACPMGLAPTTSTTMMIALGDALAVALMERRGFTADEYRLLHPGGKLGQSLVRVSDVMAVDDMVPLVGLDAPMSEILVTMTSKRLGCVGVIDGDGHLVGIFTDGDLSRGMGPDLMTRRAHEVMTRDPKTIRAGALVAEAVNYMNKTKVQCLFVVPDATTGPRIRPLGALHLQHCLSAGAI